MLVKPKNYSAGGMWFRPYLDWIPLKIADSSTCLYKKNGNTKIFSQKRVTPRWIYTKFRLQDNKTKSGSLAMATRYNRYKLHNTKRPLTSSSAQKRKPAFMEVGLVGYHEKEKNQEKPNSPRSSSSSVKWVSLRQRYQRWKLSAQVAGKPMDG